MAVWSRQNRSLCDSHTPVLAFAPPYVPKAVLQIVKPPFLSD